MKPSIPALVLVLVLVAALCLFLGAPGLFSPRPPPAPLPPAPNTTSPDGFVHEHADFIVFIDGRPLDLGDSIYMTEKDGGALCGGSGPLAHLHDNDGGVAHKHAAGLTWGYFFSTLGMDINATCLTLYNGSRYCAGPAGPAAASDALPSGAPAPSGPVPSDGSALAPARSASLAVFVDGRPVDDLSPLEIRQGQKVLVSYGASDGAAWAPQRAQIPDRARLQSRAEGCSAEGTGHADDLKPSAFVFNASAWDSAYAAASAQLDAGQTLGPVGFDALYRAAQGAPPRALSLIGHARWMDERNLSAPARAALGAAHSLSAPDPAASVCLPDEAARLSLFLRSGDLDRAAPAALTLRLDDMPAFLVRARERANSSAAYTAVEPASVFASVRALSQALQSGQPDSAEVNASLAYLQTLPC